MNGLPLANNGALAIDEKTTNMNKPRKKAREASSGIPMLQLSPTVEGEINWKISM